jgi:hypothetical protein
MYYEFLQLRDLLFHQFSVGAGGGVGQAMEQMFPRGFIVPATGEYNGQELLSVGRNVGTATKIDKVQIHWPSGKTEDLTNLAVDHYYNVVEGKGVVDPAKARPAPVKHP